MSTVQEAGRRLEAAVGRLEAALRRAPVPTAGAAAAQGGREMELLEAECHSLRQALDAAEERYRTVAGAADEVALRLERTIDELSDLVEG